MKKVWLLISLCTLLSGCAAHGRELESMALIRVLGVSGGERVTLTAVSDGAGQQDPVRGSAQGETFGEARSRLPWSGDQELALTSLSYLIINENVDVEEVLLHILNDRELSPAALVWYAGDPVGLLEECKDPAARLELLVKQGDRPPTAAELLTVWLAEGGADLPALGMEEGRLVSGGTVRLEGSA